MPRDSSRACACAAASSVWRSTGGGGVRGSAKCAHTRAARCVRAWRVATKSKTTGREKLSDLCSSASGSMGLSGPVAWPRLIQWPQRASAPRECSELAQQLIADTVSRHDVQARMLTLHADRGAAMRSKPVASLLVDLDVAKSHSRPYVSDDNPYSESQFKTMKHRPEFPDRSGCIEDARAHCQAFFAWYNEQHCHSGIGYMTPHSVHYGLAAKTRLVRQAPLDAAFLCAAPGTVPFGANVALRNCVLDIH